MTRPAADDGASTRQDGANRAEHAVQQLGHLAGGAATKHAAGGAADAAQDAAEDAVEQLADGAAGEQALDEAGDGIEQVGQEAQGGGLLAGGRAAQDAAGGQGQAAGAHGHGLVEAGHGVDKGLHEAVGVGAVLLGELLCGMDV